MHTPRFKHPLWLHPLSKKMFKMTANQPVETWNTKWADFVIVVRGWKVSSSLRGRPTYEEELAVYKSPYFGSTMAESKVRG